MKENSIEEALEKLSNGKKIKMYELLRTFKREGIENFVITRKKYVDVILSDYKRVLKENEQLRTEVNSLKEENEELNKNYNSLIDKIILKIDEYDYKFEKAKSQNKNDIADYYWDLIRNFKQLLGGE